MEKIKKTVIFVGYTCNNKCIFCINYDKRKIPPIPYDSLKREMVAAKKRGSTYLELIGGETTIRPDILKIIRFAKSLRFETIMIATNGRMLSYPEFAEAIIRAGLNSIIFSIHGHTPSLHDSLTDTPGSFKQLILGVKNVQELIKKYGFQVSLGTNTTIVKQNYKYLPQIGEYIRKLGLYNAEFIFVDPTYGGAHDQFDKLVPKISEIAPYVHKCLDIGKKYKIPHWHIRYVPLCYFQNYLNQVSEILETQIYSNSEHIAPDFYDKDAIKGRQEVGRIKPAVCKGCKLYNLCEGIWTDYIKHYGTTELKPIRK